MTSDIDEESLYHYLSFLTTPAPQTLFRNIQKLPAGHLLICDARGNIRVTRYWDALPTETHSNKDGVSDEAQRAEILRLLDESIRKRMMSDVPFGVFLSGGVDSSANVALMARQMSRPVDTFTVGFSDHEQLNELEAARQIAERFSANHHEVLIGEQEMLDFLPDLVFHQDEPIADPVCVPLYYVAKLARDSGTIVIQVGEGSDEIFSGYDKYVKYLHLYENFWQYAERAPGFARRAASVAAQGLVEKAIRKPEAAELIRRLGANEALFWGAAIVFDETLKRNLFANERGPSWDGSS
ncbi:MAG: asparagine synthetase B family protein, partial [Pyrinomonadaceae bacterium]